MKRGAVVTIVLDIPDLASVRYERDVLDLLGSSIPWDKLPEGTKLIQAHKSHYTIKDDGSFPHGHEDQGRAGEFKPDVPDK